jgi:hypothetical protein
MSEQEDYCEGWGPLYYKKMIKLQLIQQGQQNLVDSQVAEIAALKEEVARLRECKRFVDDCAEMGGFVGAAASLLLKQLDEER